MNNIFIKQSDSNKNINKNIILNKKLLLESMPKTCTNKPDLELVKIKTEWRWRFFKINDIDIVEISYKEPNCDRKYINNKGVWCNYDMDAFYDKFIVKIYYYY